MLVINGFEKVVSYLLVGVVLHVAPVLAIEDFIRDRVDLAVALLFAHVGVQARRLVPVVDCNTSAGASVVLPLLARDGSGT